VQIRGIHGEGNVTKSGAMNNEIPGIFPLIPCISGEEREGFLRGRSSLSAEGPTAPFG
jgi:hypothetical protein